MRLSTGKYVSAQDENHRDFTRLIFSSWMYVFSVSNPEKLRVISAQ
jgi:hypothetical protein